MINSQYAIYKIKINLTGSISIIFPADKKHTKSMYNCK